MRVKQGDTVYVLHGKDRGKTGAVAEVFPKEGRIIVENINIRIRHRRPKKEGQKGERIQVAMPIYVSNVMAVCPSCKKSTKIGMKIDENGKKIRICKKCSSSI